MNCNGNNGATNVLRVWKYLKVAGGSICATGLSPVTETKAVRVLLLLPSALLTVRVMSYLPSRV
ncbi:MAG: hypothetical protein ACLSG8_01640 [Barnesiella sp.]